MSTAKKKASSKKAPAKKALATKAPTKKSATKPKAVKKPKQSTQERAINSIRALTLDATTQAGSGHPGMPLGCAPMAYTLFTKVMNHNPSNPNWINRDRFVQSAGHGSMLSYSLLHLTGYKVSMSEIKNHRQLGSITAGHPEVGHTPGVEMTTGPLGQGISSAVGMAIAEAYLAANFNVARHKMFDHFTYVIAGDGCLMEGISSEASSLAGHLGLGKLIVLYDDNSITIDGSTDITFTEDTVKRYEAYGWHTQSVADGNDVTAIQKAIKAAQGEKSKPSLIAIKTIIGFGTDVQGTDEAHGKALKADQKAEAKERLGIDWANFSVPKDVSKHYGSVKTKGKQTEAKWNTLFKSYKKAAPEKAKQLTRILAGEVPELDLPVFPTTKNGGTDDATRNWSSKALNVLAPQLPEIIGGSADLAGSTKNTILNSGHMQTGKFKERNINFGVREHAMGAIANGIALHGLKPQVATFLIFSDYLRPSIRLAALMKQPVTYVFTHDSIGVGGDGPTHQPIEQVMSLRAIPNLNVIRPADANETVQAWACAVSSNTSPTALCLTRQKVPTLKVPKDSVKKGAYVAADSKGTPKLILIATGSEVALALDAKEALDAKGIATRVVSMPCMEYFEAQNAAYKEKVLPSKVKARVAIEAGSSLGWERYVSSEGTVLGIDRFGESGEGNAIFEAFGFTVENITKIAQTLVK